MRWINCTAESGDGHLRILQQPGDDSLWMTQSTAQIDETTADAGNNNGGREEDLQQTSLCAKVLGRRNLLCN